MSESYYSKLWAKLQSDFNDLLEKDEHIRDAGEEEELETTLKLTLPNYLRQPDSNKYSIRFTTHFRQRKYKLHTN